MSIIDTSIAQYLIPSENIRALIFDLDGTIADTMPTHLTSWRMLGEHFGVPITDKMINDLAGTPTPEVAIALNEQFGWTLDPDKVQHMKNVTYAQVKKQSGPVQPIQKVYDFAAAYRGKLPMSIGTGSNRANADAALDDMGITAWFKTVVTAEDVTNGKPHPETFLACAEAMNVPPQYCQVYEDGPSGIDAALAAGMRVVNIETQELHLPA